MLHYSKSLRDSEKTALPNVDKNLGHVKTVAQMACAAREDW